MDIKSFGAALILTSLCAAPVLAHHSHAMYEAERRITVTGTATELQWSNPHVWLYMEGTDDTGESGNWVLEGGAPAELTRQGWTGEFPKPGDTITVVIRPLKEGSRGGLIRTITFADGLEFGYVSPDTD